MSRQSLLAAFFAVLYLVAMVAPDIYIHTTYVSPLGSALLGMLWWLPSAAIVATFAAAQLGGTRCGSGVADRTALWFHLRVAAHSGPHGHLPLDALA